MIEVEYLFHPFVNEEWPSPSTIFSTSVIESQNKTRLSEASVKLFAHELYHVMTTMINDMKCSVKTLFIFRLELPSSK